MVVTLAGIVMEVRSVHSWNAPSLIVVTLLGISMLVKPEQPEKALSPMVVTLLGMIVLRQANISVFVSVSIIPLQLSRESYFGFFDSTLMEVRPVQPEKAEPSMLVTLAGMVMEVRLVQL